MSEKDNSIRLRAPRRGGMGGPMGGGPMGGGPVEKAKDFKGAIKKLVSYIGRYKIGVLFVIIFAIGGTIFSIIGPKILGKATTEIFTGITGKITGGPGIDFNKVGQILIMVLSLYVISALFSFVQGYIMTGISQKVAYRLRKDMSLKINRLPMKYFDGRTHGEVLSRITNDVDTLGMSLNQSITTLITSFTTIIGVLIMMLTISPLMTVITLLILPISGVLMSFTMKKSQKFFAEQQKYLGHISGQVEETFGGQSVVKVFNREEESIKTFEKTNQILYKSAWKSQFISGMMMPIMSFVGNLGYVGVVILGGILAINGSITVGDIQAFIQYVRTFTQPIAQLAQVMNMLQSMAAAAERVFEFLSEEEESQTAENHADIKASELKGNVRFENVNFGYSEDKIIINNFSADIKEGQKVAIVGPTGAGKTTMVKLLMRFYDVNSGAILIDGSNIKDFDRGELRQAFGMVLQDTWLFKGSIMENIRYGNLEATDAQVIEAAKAANAHHFIKTLPDGYCMELNEEADNVSQGQKQLITIARAILSDNKILILDEATSSVDTRTEERIQMAMDNLMQGRTSFIIAHRLSTIRNADLIIVMDNGDIVEQGTHDELIVKGEFYANLYNSQFEKTA